MNNTIPTKKPWVYTGSREG